MNEYHRHFLEFIQCHYKVYPDRRQLEYICCQIGKGNCNKPHKYRIRDHSKSGITTTSEAAAYQAGIDAFPHKTPGCHNDKDTKIIDGGLCQFVTIEIHYHWSNRQNNATSDQADNNCDPEHAFSVFSGCVNTVFAQLLTDNDRSCIGEATTGDGTNIYHHNSNCICRNHIIADMTKDRCKC